MTYVLVAIVVSIVTSLAAVTSASKPRPHELATVDGPKNCPRCLDLFSKLETTDDGKLMQVVQMQERGEPKSGTTMMGRWARKSLDGACDYLRLTYGKESCNMTTVDENVILTFIPRMASESNGTCSCDAIDTVSISVSLEGKHELPVERSCRWWHDNGITREYEGCHTFDGDEVTNYMELTSCIEEAACKLTDDHAVPPYFPRIADDRLQFVPIRDPRPETVSSYFHMEKHKTASSNDVTLDEYFLNYLPLVCQWVALRHYVFGGLLAGSSKLFWYEDAVDDPVAWHIEWTHFAGLQLPIGLVEIIAYANEESSSFLINAHVEGEVVSEDRTWKDEVSVETLDAVNDILRLWLPPVLLARFGVPL